MSYKPEGYTSLAPYLIVPDAEATLQFVETVFDGKRLRVITREDGSIMHAEARIDDTVLMIGQMPEGPSAHVHLYVRKPYAVFARALSAGGTEVQPIEDQGDGDLRGGVADASGTVWWIAQQMPNI